MVSRTPVLTGCLGLAAALATAVTAHAWNSRVDHLTFNGSVALPGVVLASGRYTFELAPPAGGLDVVRVRTRAGRRVVYSGFTLAVMRPAGMPQDQAVTFGEAAAGQPAPIAAWFPTGSSSGHRFLYR